jgi:hypothetical protein
VHIPDSYVLMAAWAGSLARLSDCYGRWPRGISGCKRRSGWERTQVLRTDNGPGTQRVGSTPVGGAWVSGSDYREPLPESNKARRGHQMAAGLTLLCQISTRLTAVVFGVEDFQAIAADFQAYRGFGMVSRASVTRPLRVLGPSQGRCQPRHLFSSRIDAAPSTT